MNTKNNTNCPDWCSTNRTEKALTYKHVTILEFFFNLKIHTTGGKIYNAKFWCKNIETNIF